MKRYRPYIPLAVRVAVSIRQLNGIGRTAMRLRAGPAAWVLQTNLRWLFGEGVNLHLDHDPPLRARTYNPRIKDPAARYTPNANDPAHLVYRTDVDHRRKTNLRGDGAQFPDRVLINRERRREKPKRKGPKIQSRSNWPTGRKIVGRKPWARKTNEKTATEN